MHEDTFLQTLVLDSLWRDFLRQPLANSPADAQTNLAQAVNLMQGFVCALGYLGHM